MTDSSDPFLSTPYDTTSDLSADSDPSQAGTPSPTDSFVPGSAFRRRAAPVKEQKDKSKQGKDKSKKGKGKGKHEKAKNGNAKATKP